MKADRALDLLFAGSALLALGPVLAVAACAVAIDDGAPLLFRQERLGRHRRPFEILKLRTMRDGNVTRAGRWLRGTGLDELPQFLNVVRGEMSVVGPRPLTEHDVVRLGLGAERFSVKPGITGLAQLYGGRGTRHTQRLERLQIARKSPALDVRIVAASFLVNVVGKKRTKAWLSRLGRRARLARRTVRSLARAIGPASTAARPVAGTSR